MALSKKRAAKHAQRGPAAKAKKPAARAAAKKSAPAKAARKPVTAKAAKAKAPARHPLAVRVAAMLGVRVEEAIERAVHELAERLGLHHVEGAPAAQKPASAEAKPSAPSGGAARADAKAAAAQPGAAPAQRVIESMPIDTTPLAARTVSSSSPAKAYSPSSLPQRLYVALDGRGIDGGMPLEVINFPCTLGSGRRNTIWINSPRIETQHAQIVDGPEGWALEDLGSEHGTLFQGERIGRRVLSNGDLFLLAGYLRLKIEMR